MAFRQLSSEVTPGSPRTEGGLLIYDHFASAKKSTIDTREPGMTYDR
jgi:hypothetical protein